MLKILDRFKEPSTWAGITALMAGFGISIPEGLWKNITMTLMGVFGILSCILVEGGDK